jgi:hypothetical protein
MKRALTALSLILAISSLLPAEEGRPTGPKPAVLKKLVQQLGSEDPVIRDYAEAELLKVGEDGLADLKREREGDLAKDAEVRARLDKIVAKIERDLARATLRVAAAKSAEDWCAAQACPRCAKKAVWKPAELAGSELDRLFPKTVFYWLHWECCPPDRFRQVPSELLAVGTGPDAVEELTDYSKLVKLDPWLAPALTDEEVKALGAAIAGLCRCIGSERKPAFAPADGVLEAQPDGEKWFDAGGLKIPFTVAGRIKPLIIYAR